MYRPTLTVESLALKILKIKRDDHCHIDSKYMYLWNTVEMQILRKGIKGGSKEN